MIDTGFLVVMIKEVNGKNLSSACLMFSNQ